MADYNRQNFNSMKQEAVRNAQEMHKRTAETPENKTSSNDKPPVNNTKNFSEQKKNMNSGGILGFADGIFDSLGISKGKTDSDKIMIVLMIIILAREGADLKLLIALGYILM
jgi:hypothetical protein